MKKYILITVMTLLTVSCTNSFLDEKMVSTITQDYLTTEEGINQLVVGTYNAERLRFQYGEGPYMFETGLDCSQMGGTTSGSDADMSKYSSSEWSTSSTIGTWTYYYMGFQSKQQSGFNINCFPIIDNCNKGITAIQSGSATGEYASDAAYAAERLSELFFNRDYLFFSMNTVLGDIPVSTTSITSIPSNYYYPRVSSEDLYKRMISDLRYCVNNLPASWSAADYGRVTKYAAAHLLAKLYLHRAQGANYGTSTYGRNTDGSIDNTNPKSYLGMLYKGNVSTDLDSCIYYSNLVINSGKYKLETNYADIFKHPLNDYSNESSKEIILPCLYGTGTDNYRYGARTLIMFVNNYTSNMWGIPNYSWENGTAPNFYFRNNDWGYDVYTDKINDSRFQGSFKLEYKTALMGGTTSSPAADLNYYAYNNSSNTTYQWTSDQASYFNANILPTYNRASWGGRQAVAGQHKMGTGDLAFAYLENTKATAIDVDKANAQPFVLFARWMTKNGKYFYRPQIVASGKTYSFVGSSGVSSNFYGYENSTTTASTPCCDKYDDSNRNSNNGYLGTRDIPVFRLAETYLIRAEAYGRKGDYSDAINDINTVRTRAAFHVGNTRNEVIARLYSGHENLTAAEQQYPYSVASDGFNAIKVDASYWDGSSAKSTLEDYPSSATTTLDRFINFLCNEFAREFNEEIGPYYEELHNSGWQADRIQWHSEMGSSSAAHSSLWGVTSDNSNGTLGQTGLAKGAFDSHYTLKPFPKTQFLDLLTDKNGKQLSTSAEAAYQNYGY
jgi:starch-binding outer membrane protein, SusD/RagB family